MAQRVRIELTDDLDGTPAVETVTFSLDGIGYEIDLNEKNAAALRDAVALYVASGRKVSGGRPSRAKKSGGAGSPSANVVREWARSRGMEVSERGRVSDQVKAAYRAAHA